MSQSSQIPSETPIGADSQAEAHLAELHKMSTTAGITNRDYVAVNQTAVASVFLGLAGLLAFFGYLMLIFPVAAVICAIAALRQIGNSSGTQTGKGLAILGLALGLGCGGGAIGREISAAMDAQREAMEVGRPLNEFGQCLVQGRYKDSYKLLDQEVKDRITLEQWEKAMELIQGPTSLGKLQVLEWNGVTPVFESSQGSRVAYTKVKVKFSRTGEERYDAALRKAGSQWKISKLLGLVPEPPRRPPPGANKADQFNIN